MFHKVNEKDDAVSPVIGVMLMLIVTVVIAAVVVAFATGTVSDSPGLTPTALLEYSGQNTDSQLRSFDIKHNGGDTLSLDNILVVIDPVGSYNYGIMLDILADNLEVLGKDSSLASAGDIIRVSIPNLYYAQFSPDVIIKWRVSDIRTNGVMADGEFVVSDEEV